jgi:methyltransferase (TIGR00027 family)
MTAQDNKPTGGLAGVGSTAFGVAAARAEESARPDRLFDDPFAAEFLRAAGPEQDQWSGPQGRQLRAAMGDYLALRTVFFDEFLLTATREGCRQVVLLAAGLDTRAHRLPWPAAVRIFELDHPDVLGFKAGVLGSRTAGAQHVQVSVDLREEWSTELVSRGFRPELPTAWLVEGLLVYLSAQEAQQLFSTIGALSASASKVGLEYVSRPMLESRQTQDALAATEDGPLHTLASLWRNDLADAPRAWLLHHGWKATERDLAALAAAYDRPTPPAFDPAIPGTSRVGLFIGDRT